MQEEVIDKVEDQAEPTLREQLEGAMQASKEKEVDDPEAISNDKPRDVSGKFAKKDDPKDAPKAKEAKEPAKPEDQHQEATPVLSAPNTWTAAAKAKWAGIAPEIQAEIAKREAEVEKGFTKLDEERSVGKTFKEVVSPYMSIINAEGGTPITAIKSLLNTAYILRTAPAQQKTQLFAQLAQQYGVDLSQVSQSKPTIDPQLGAIQQELMQLKNERQRDLDEKDQQQKATLQSTIDAFAADPKNVHFETVKAEMAALLQAGRAKDLQEAYDKAVWAHPDVRSTLLEQQLADKEANRVANIKARADAARKASVSLVGAPGATSAANPNVQNRSLREELEANLLASVS